MASEKRHLVRVRNVRLAKRSLKRANVDRRETSANLAFLDIASRFLLKRAAPRPTAGIRSIVGSGTYAVVLPSNNDDILEKTILITESSDLHQSDDPDFHRVMGERDLVNEALLSGAKLGPNFMRVLNASRAPRVKLRGGKAYLPKSGALATFTTVERVQGVKLCDWIYQNPGDTQGLDSIIAQLFLANAKAGREYDFSHGDAHDENVLVRPAGKNGESVTLMYDIPGERVYYVVTRWIATFIDFGRSNARIPVDDIYNSASNAVKRRVFERPLCPGLFSRENGKTFAQIGICMTEDGIDYGRPARIRDVVKLIGNCTQTAVDSGDTALYHAACAWLAPLLGPQYTPRDAVQWYDANGERWTCEDFSAVPHDIEIDPFDLVMIFFRRSDQTTVFTRPSNRVQ